MNKKISVYLISLLVAFGCQTKSKKVVDYLILNANIVDVANNKLIENQLIGISSDTIRVVDYMQNKGNYTSEHIIDAEGNFVMPGLWDMHVHFRGGDSLITQNKNLLPLFLTYGITTVRDAGGDITPSVLQWRDSIREGNLPGPYIFTSGPKLDGEKPAWAGSIKVTNNQEAEKALDSLQKLGVDYVKLYDGSLTKENYYSIIQKAEERGLKITGHMPLTAKLTTAINDGLDGSEHMYYLLKACSPLEDSLTEANPTYGMMSQIADSYDQNLAENVFKNVAQHRTFITPTLFISETLATLTETEHNNDSLLQYIGPGIQETYKRRIEAAKRASARGDQMREKVGQRSTEMITPMFNSGVPILAGSDCGAYNSFVYPGQSLHGELRSLERAGLTPQQVLVTSVLNGPSFFGLSNYYGSIEPGKKADLLIMYKNPLEKVENLTSINGVFSNNAWFDQFTLHSMLEDIANYNRNL